MRYGLLMDDDDTYYLPVYLRLDYHKANTAESLLAVDTILTHTTATAKTWHMMLSLYWRIYSYLLQHKLDNFWLPHQFFYLTVTICARSCRWPFHAHKRLIWEALWVWEVLFRLWRGFSFFFTFSAWRPSAKMRPLTRFSLATLRRYITLGDIAKRAGSPRHDASFMRQCRYD